MSHDLKSLSREWFEQVWNQRDESSIARLASPTALLVGLSEDGQPAVGVEHFVRFWRALLSAFPDLKCNIEDVLLDCDKTVIRLNFNGTHTGKGIEVPPTGRRFTATAIVILRWQEGKIAESWNEFDAAGMMRQLQSPTAKLRA